MDENHASEPNEQQAPEWVEGRLIPLWWEPVLETRLREEAIAECLRIGQQRRCIIEVRRWGYVLWIEPLW